MDEPLSNITRLCSDCADHHPGYRPGRWAGVAAREFVGAFVKNNNAHATHTPLAVGLPPRGRLHREVPVTGQGLLGRFSRLPCLLYSPAQHAKADQHRAADPHAGASAPHTDSAHPDLLSMRLYKSADVLRYGLP